MVGAYTVALVGFAQNESSAIESFLRLAARRPPAYHVQDEVMDAQLLLVNADNLQALYLVRHAELPGRVLLLGRHDGGTGWPLQRKPVKLVGVLAALDALVGVRKSVAPRKRADPPPAFAATEPFRVSQLRDLGTSTRKAGSSRPVSITSPLSPAIPPLRRETESEFPPTRPMHRGEPLRVAAAAASVPVVQMPLKPLKPLASLTARRPGVLRLTDFGSPDELPLPPTAPPPVLRNVRSSRSTRPPTGGSTAALPEVPRGDMLLVAESLVEGRILHKRFRRYGLAIDWSREAPQALMMLKAQAYRLVVIDRLSGEPDAWQVCRVAKQGRLPNGQSPVVVMFAPTAGSMDRMKAGLAGSDAYLSLSVGEADLYKVLAQHRLVSLNGFEKTNIGF
jgi:CheY-like chemotaxis protein